MACSLFWDELYLLPFPSAPHSCCFHTRTHSAVCILFLEPLLLPHLSHCCTMMNIGVWLFHSPYDSYDNPMLIVSVRSYSLPFAHVKSLILYLATNALIDILISHAKVRFDLCGSLVSSHSDRAVSSQRMFSFPGAVQSWSLVDLRSLGISPPGRGDRGSRSPLCKWLSSNTLCI